MLDFHVTAWHGDDVEIDHDDDDEESKKKYVVRIFGRAVDGRSVCCSVDFFPYFFISLPKKYGNADAAQLRKTLMAKMGKRFSRDVVDDACVVVRRKKFYGFTGGQTHAFLRMVFRTRHAYAVAAKIVADVISPEKRIVGEHLDLYESNVDPVLKLIHCRDLDATGWMRVDKSTSRQYHHKESTCDIEIVARYDALSKSPDTHHQRPVIVIASFDIETNSRDGSFPDPDLEGNEVIQIATVYQRYGDPEPFAREIFCLGKTAPVEGTDVRCFDTEPEVLAAWSEALRARDVDVLVGYNVWGFDMNYMYKRAMFNYDAETLRQSFLGLGKILGTSSSLRKTVLSSSAYGHNEFMILETPGVLQIDLLHVLRKEHKLESYSLNAVSRHFLGDEKIDMPARTMFALYATRDPENLAKIAEYCVKDCDLPLRLIDKLAVVPNMIEMSRATHVPMDYLIVRGQQIKVFSQILKRLREKGYVCPANPKKGTDGGYVGATVLEPKRGAYMDHPIVTLDFASLYPSIMRSSRLCPSTIVLDPAYADLPGVEYLTIDVEGTEYRFAQNTEAIVPDLLRDLAQYRKQAKKDMADAKKRGDAFMTSVYDGKQLAIKVSMNSAYGFFGAANGYLPCAPIAAAVTTIGRRMIDATKAFVERRYEGADVVYGDSVMPYTPILVKHAETGEVLIRRIEDVFLESGRAVAYDGFLSQGTAKERCDLSCGELLTWTHMGWQPILRVIRHKSQKRIHRVVTHTAVVDVTEDHSLIAADGSTLLKPANVGVGTRLLHGFPELAPREHGIPISEDLAYCYGFMVGDGSCGRYETPSGIKYSWALNNSSLDLLKICKTRLEKAHPGCIFKLLDTLQSSHVYKLVPVKNVKPIVEQYREACYDGLSKKIPNEVLFGDDAVKQSFFEGLWDSDGCREDFKKKGSRRIDTKNHITAQHYSTLLKIMGYNVSLNTRRDKPDIFRVTFTKLKQRKDPLAIKKIYTLHESWDGYVYDLETAAGSFQAGIGGLIVKNTDSVMIKFPSLDVAECFRLGQEAADAATALFKDPVKLEFEKVFHPYFLFAKKRYCGVKITALDADGVPKDPSLDFKGIQLARRDNCPLVRTVSRQVLDALMFQRNRDAAIAIVRRAARDLLEGRVSVDQLVLSKTLKPESAYKNANQPHVHVARRIEARNGVVGSGPRSGERVPYVFVEAENPAALQYTKAEDPEYVAEAGLRVDSLYYLEHQLESPMISLFELLMDDPQRVLFDDLKAEYVAQRKADLKEFKRKQKLKKEGLVDITSFFSKKISDGTT